MENSVLNPYQKLLKLLNLDESTFTMSGTLNDLKVDAKTKTWFFNISFEKTPLFEQFQKFHERLLGLKHQLEHANNIHYQYHFKTFDETQVTHYVHYILQLLSIDRPRTEVLTTLGYELRDKDLIFVIPEDADFIYQWEADLKEYFLKLGFEFSFIFKKKETTSIAQRIETIDQEDDEKRAVVHKAQSFLSYQDQTVDPLKHAIKDIPLDEVSLAEYTSAYRQSSFKFVGEIFSVDKRKIREDMVLFQYVVGDEEGSIYVKKFAHDEGEIRFLDTAEEGHLLKVDGKANFDKFNGEVVITAQNLEVSKFPVEKALRNDDAKEKRVELHVHTKMSTLDGIDRVEDFVATALRFQHPAIAITDHDNVQAFPAFAQAVKNQPIKPIYGAELSVYFDENLHLYKGQQDTDVMEQVFVVFDIETTGLSILDDEIIEISAIKIQGQQTIDRFDTFVKAHRPLSNFTTELTTITDQDLKDAPDLDTVMKKFHEFINGSVLVAHNAPFDVDFIEAALRKFHLFEGSLERMDTLQMARQLYAKQLKRFNLKAVAKHFNVELTQHHRAAADAFATAEIFKSMIADLYAKGFKTLHDYHDVKKLDPTINISDHARKTHVTVWVKNQTGLKNLYTLISKAHTVHFNKGPLLPFKEIIKHHDGLIVSSGCMHSDFIETAFNKDERALEKAMEAYDVIELQSPDQYLHLFENELKSEKNSDAATTDILDKVHRMIKRVVEIAHQKSIPVIATSDAHYIEAHDAKYRDIYIQTPIVGGGYHELARVDKAPLQYFKTTDEMLSDFAFLNEYAHPIVVENTRMIESQVEKINPFPHQLYAPSDTFLAQEGIPSAVAALKKVVQESVLKTYGETPHAYVQDRIDKELKSIIDNQFSSVYYISYLLVQKSLQEGYLVGSRGSVGSSLIATLMQITEVNPLAPHYRCPSCHFFSFKRSPEDIITYPISDPERPFVDDLNHVDSGFDLRSLNCPHCETPLNRDGHDIPFETFLGFKGDKVPDIDLNFSGDYQAEIHEYIRTIFGKDRAFRAGTISTVASKTAYGYVKGYLEKTNQSMRKADIDRTAKIISGVKRSTGQHPGGIVVVPFDKEITDVTPVQYPADDVSSNWQTTHFDYHSFEANLFKLDVLGHDDPTMIKVLMDYVKKNPLDFPFADARDIPLDDPKVYQLLAGTDVIGVSKEALRSNVASYGVPEMGTSFVRNMLEVSQPKTFADIVKISGLSHGTDVWLNNAEMLVTGKHKQFPQVPFKEVIGCRDDIMVSLIQYGISKEVAFEISEFIRKGKPSKELEAWEGYITIMKDHQVPDWYIWSCGQIKYMFPKAHATAYVMMALRIAWFKVYRPIYFYAAYFSIRAKDFDLMSFLGGAKVIESKIESLEEKGNKATDTEKRLLTVLEVALEMTLRGFHFEPIDVSISMAKDFTVTTDKTGLRLPFVALEGLGQKVAESIVIARDEKIFNSHADLKERTLVSKTVFDKLLALDALSSLPEDTQVRLFDI